LKGVCFAALTRFFELCRNELKTKKNLFLDLVEANSIKNTDTYENASKSLVQLVEDIQKITLWSTYKVAQQSQKLFYCQYFKRELFSVVWISF